MEIHKIILNEATNASLTCYIQRITDEDWGMTSRPMMIVIPGGGYQYCSEREADPIAFAFLEAGFHVAILRYSLGENAVWPNPLTDYENAYRIIGENADEWQVNMSAVCVVGFSAGGHLAASCATMSKCKPSAALLGYPCITSETTDRFASVHMPNVCDYVDGNTCPCFIFASANDGTVPITDSIKFMQALAENGVTFESHIYAFANHGFSTCESFINNREWCCNRTPDWVGDSIEFLKDVVGDYTQGKFGTRKHW